jgi:hypothetical protein
VPGAFFFCGTPEPERAGLEAPGHARLRRPELQGVACGSASVPIAKVGLAHYQADLLPGRDIDNIEYAMRFDRTILGDASEVRKSNACK